MSVRLDRPRWYSQCYDLGPASNVVCRLSASGGSPISWLLLLVLSSRRCRWVWAIGVSLTAVAFVLRIEAFGLRDFDSIRFYIS